MTGFLKPAFYHSHNIFRGVRDMLLLRPSWCEHIGNTRVAFMLALFVNIAAVPAGAWFALQGTRADGAKLALGLPEQLMIELLMLAVTLLVIFLLTLCRWRMHKFAVVYAGVTYSGLVITAVLFAVHGVMLLYSQSLYGQNAPLLAHSLLLGAIVWMLILTSFVFKTALKVGAASSVVMTAVLFFVIIAGRNILQILWLNL